MTRDEAAAVEEQIAEFVEDQARRLSDPGWESFTRVDVPEHVCEYELADDDEFGVVTVCVVDGCGNT